MDRDPFIPKKRPPGGGRDRFAVTDDPNEAISLPALQARVLVLAQVPVLAPEPELEAAGAV
jgi:hypothetical protein